MVAASGLLSAAFIVVCLLGDVRLSSVDCPCPPIPLLSGTKNPPEDCRQINSTFRYTCLEGTVRKAGTSNRIRCQRINGSVGWDKPSLQCIDDPRRPKPQTTTKTTTTDDHSDDTQSTPVTSAATFSTSLHTNQTEVVPEEKVRDDVGEERHDAVTPTTTQTWTTETSTSSQDMSNTSMFWSHRGGQAGAVSSVVAVCALVGLIFLLYRRSRSNTPRHPAEELVHMNPSPT